MDALPSFDLTGRTALVTGAGRGLGRAIALALAAAGADLALGLRRADADGGLADEVSALGRRALRLQMDVTDLPESYAAIDRAVAELGGIDILVNNAGGGIDAPALEVTEADFDRAFAWNVKSTFFLSQRVARHMINAGQGGRIVNLSSQAALVALPGEPVYCAGEGGGLAPDALPRGRVGPAPASTSTPSPRPYRDAGRAPQALVRPGVQGRHRRRASQRCTASAGRSRWRAPSSSWPRRRRR